MSAELKVAHLIATNFYGGPERQIVTHARHLQGRGSVPYVVTFKENGLSAALVERASSGGIATHTLNSRGAFNPCVIGELARFLRDEGITILCAHGYKANVVGRFASWMAGIPMVAVSRGWTGESLRVSCYEVLDKLFLRLASHVVAVSEGQREKVLKTGIAQGKTSVIRNSIELGRYNASSGTGVRSELHIPGDACLIASAGRLSPEKNYVGLIEAAKTVCKTMSGVHFVVWGEGVQRPRLERAIRESGLENVFHVPGFRNDLDSIMGEIDIFVLSSWTEGLPNVVLEAFACRRPVVATAVGGTPEVVDHGVNGLLTQPGDNGGMAEALMRLAGDGELCRAMGENGYRAVAERFSFEAQTDQYLELFRSLLNPHHAGSRPIVD